jgi:hypothetical protein
VKHWPEVAALLADALAGERHRLAAEDTRVVQDYIEHNEFGLAHDHLLDALADKELPLLERTKMLLCEAAGLMGINGRAH